MNTFLSKLTRRQISSKNEVTSVLASHLNLISLTCLSISNSIGSGIYIQTGLAAAFAGKISKYPDFQSSNFYYILKFPGPFVVISYIISGLACLLSAFCFAELSSRIKSSSGSSYSYIYNTIGELVAFSSGYMTFISALASFSATSIAWSDYLDSATNDTIKDFINHTMHATWNFGPLFSTYFNLSAVVITIIVFIISLIGIRVATQFNNILAILNILLLIIISISGFIYGKFENLSKTKYENGFSGILKGSSIVMYAFIGFETSTFAVDETVNPSRNVPLSLLISVSIITIVYSFSAFSLNLMVPFDQINTNASFPTAFLGVKWMFWLTSIGPILSISGALLSGLYGTVRIAYSMAKDGLLFAFLSSIHEKTQVPNIATYASLFICLTLTLLLNVPNLIGFSNIVGFLTYSLVGVSLLIFRYYQMENDEYLISINDSDQENVELIRPNIFKLIKRYLNGSTEFQRKLSNKMFFNRKINAVWLIVLIFFSNILLFGLIVNLNESKIIVIIAILLNLIYAVTLSLFKQAKIRDLDSFQVPLVPFVPILVIIANNYLMMACEGKQWLIFFVILLIGLPFYFLYGIKHSKAVNIDENLE